MNHDEHDPLWELLGKARRHEASPFFSRNVVRAVREENAGRGEVGFFPWLRSWRFAALGTCTAAAVTVLVVFRAEPPAVEAAPESLQLLAQQVSVGPDYHVIRDLDELLDAENSSVWLDGSVY